MTLIGTDKKSITLLGANGSLIKEQMQIAEPKFDQRVDASLSVTMYNGLLHRIHRLHLASVAAGHRLKIPVRGDQEMVKIGK